MTAATLDLTTLTPVEIDTFLSDNWQEQARWSGYLASTQKSLDRERDRYVKRHGSLDGFGEGYAFSNDAQLVKSEKEYLEKLRALRDEAAPYEDEYATRPWKRYFLVTNSNGHVHRGTNCSTCYFTTQYAWLVDLADCDETAMVEEYGTSACTVCFPDAPTLPAWKRHEEADAAAQALKDAKVCPNSGGVSAHYGRLSREACETCGAYVPITRNGYFRKHDRKDAK